MPLIKAKVRTWGRSLGVVIPQEDVTKAHIKPGDTIEMIILRKDNTLNELFGSVKFNRSTEDIQKAIDEEGWDE